MFEQSFIEVSGNAFSSPKNKVLLFIQSFLSCQQKRLFKLQRSLFKTLSLATIFFDFSDAPVNRSSFSSSRNVSEFSISASGNQFSVQLKEYSFIQRFFSARGNREIQFMKKTLFLLVKTDFLASDNLFLLPFSGTPATVSFIFPSHGNAFLNES